MIVVKLQGGLGNQMFQYAAGRHLALRNHTELLLDLTFFRQKEVLNYTPRSFDLGFFNIKAKCRKDFWRHPYLRNVLAFLHRVSYVREGHDSFLPEKKNLQGTLYLDGYWQSERYFIESRKYILEDFSFLPAFDKAAERYAEHIRSCNAVSIHVRRGDYVDSTIYTYTDLYASGYYENAARRVSETIDKPVFFIFSDDVKWAIENIQLQFPHYFVNGHQSGHYADMYLMSLCKHNIIANSSFSWWSAWLNQNEEKMVVAPLKWFNDPLIVTTDLIPSGWIRI